MTRVALACLLLLVACKAKDPEGTIQPDKDGLLSFTPFKVGDSQPFRLVGGDTHFGIIPDMTDQTAATRDSCQPEIQLVRYGESSGQNLPYTGAAIGRFKVNGIKPGVYFFRLKANSQYCKYIGYTSRQ